MFRNQKSESIADQLRAISQAKVSHMEDISQELPDRALRGGGFWQDFGRGFKMVMKPALKITKTLAPMTGNPYGIAIGAAAGVADEALGKGKTGGKKRGRPKGKKNKKKDDDLEKQSKALKDMIKKGGMKKAGDDKKEEKKDDKKKPVSRLRRYDKKGDGGDGSAGASKSSGKSGKEDEVRGATGTGSGKKHKLPKGFNEAFQEKPLSKALKGSGNTGRMVGGQMKNSQEMKGSSMSGFGKSGGSNKKPKVKRQISEARRQALKKRGAVIKKLMKEKGLKLGQASKYIKANPELLK